VLDYTNAFAARAGLEEGISLRSEMVMAATPHRDGAHRADDRPAAHYGAVGERVRSPADRQPLEPEAGSESDQRGVGEQLGVPPLVPAITTSARTVDQVAREAAAQHMEGGWETVGSLGAGVIVDRDRFVELVAKSIQQRDGDVSALAKAVAEPPEVFGALRGKAGSFGETGSGRRFVIWRDHLPLTWATPEGLDPASRTGGRYRAVEAGEEGCDRGAGSEPRK